MCIKKFSDLFLSTELIPKRKLKKWIHRAGFATRKIVILKWIFLGNILTMAYKSTLLSSLIPIRYENTINSINDLDNSGLPLLIPKGGANEDIFSSDQRPIMRRIFNRIIFYTYKGGIPQWVLDM